MSENMLSIETMTTGRMQPSQNPRRDVRFHLHRSHFLEYVDLAKERGLEIGAFDLPLVEPSEGRCDLADWNTAEYLRDLAERRPGHNPEYVAPVQFNLRQGYDQIPEGYDWIGASHVIEHVPDIIAWLTQMHSKLRPGGILFLVIPDKRYTFDIYRRESTFTDALVAQRAALKHPSFAQVFDYFYYSAPGVIAHDVWAGNPVPGPKLDFAESLMLAEKAEHEYADSHCWVLTPDSFLALMRSLTDSHVTNFQLVGLRPTAPNMLDFSVVLRK
jgi:SAM-dependent methyltransferase